MSPTSYAQRAVTPDGVYHLMHQRCLLMLGMDPPLAGLALAHASSTLLKSEGACMLTITTFDTCRNAAYAWGAPISRGIFDICMRTRSPQGNRGGGTPPSYPQSPC